MCDTQIDIMIDAVILVGHVAEISIVHLSKDYHEINIQRQRG